MQSQTAPTPVAAPTYPFAVPPLPYAYEALEPYLDAATMHLHHDQHHQAYVDKLNEALKDYPDWQQRSIEDILRHLDDVPEAIRPAVRNQGGGHANHALFWQLMGPGPAGRQPTGALAAIKESFGSFEAFQKAFNAAGAGVFGSGWAYVVCSPNAEQLEIVALPNQDSVLSLGKYVLLGNDVWEHAYYLKYQNKRADYLAAWWNVINWDFVAQRLADYRGQ